MDIKLQVGVKILLKNKENKYLLLQRPKGIQEDTSQMWDLPGGRIDPGISLMENLKREIKEETQLDFSGFAKLVAAQDLILRENKHIVRLTYIGEMDGNPILSEEHETYQWFTFKELEELDRLDPYVAELIERNVLHETR